MQQQLPPVVYTKRFQVRETIVTYSEHQAMVAAMRELRALRDRWQTRTEKRTKPTRQDIVRINLGRRTLVGWPVAKEQQ